MTPTERIGELVANALAGNIDGEALQQSIAEHLDISEWSVSINWAINTDRGLILEIRVPRP